MANINTKALEIKARDLTSITDMHLGHVRAIFAAIGVMSRDAANAAAVRDLATCGNWLVDNLGAEATEFCGDIISISKEIR